MEEEKTLQKEQDSKHILIGILLVFLLVVSIVASILLINANKKAELLSDEEAYELFAESAELTNNYEGLVQAEGATAGFNLLFEYDNVNKITHTKVSINQDSFTETYDDTVSAYSTFDSGENWYVSETSDSTFLNSILAPNQDSSIEESYDYEGLVDCNGSKGECHQFRNKYDPGDGGTVVLINDNSKLVDSFILSNAQEVLVTFDKKRSIEIPENVINSAQVEEEIEISEDDTAEEAE